MKGIASAMLVIALAGCAAGQSSRTERIDRMLGGEKANPSAVIATELAFARAAQDDGQWAAFRDFATKDAVMFVPERTNAQDWLKGRAEPPVAVQWQPAEVWMSCDGSYGVTRGPWQRPAGVGYFTTVWQRQRNGEYKWVLDQGDALAEPMPVGEMIAAQVADCSTPNSLTWPDAPAGADRATGQSSDGTLVWQSDVMPDGSRHFSVQRWTGTSFETVIDSKVAAGG